MDAFNDRIALPGTYTILGTFAAMAVLCFIMPASRRVHFAVGQMAFLLTLSRLRDLDMMAGLAKVSSAVAILLVVWTAIFHPGPRRRVSEISWLHLVVAAISVLLVLPVEDQQLAVSLRLQWCGMVGAALCVCTTIVDQKSLERVVKGVFLGLAAGVTIAVSPVLVDPGSAFGMGFGRFTPYGCNPNQIAVVFAMTTVLGIYFALTARYLVTRNLYLLIVMMSATGVVLTVSRMALLIVGVSSLPCLLKSSRIPIVGMSLLIGAGLIYGQLSEQRPSDANFDHLDQGFDTGRFQYASIVLEEIRYRPYFGLWTSSGCYAYDEELNAHNAYIEMLYLGGLAYALPIFGLYAFSLFSIFQCWRVGMFQGNLLLQTLAAVYLVSVANGFVNNIIHYPTYTWSFLHLLVQHTFIQLWLSKSKALRHARLVSRFSPSRVPLRIA